MDIAVEPLPGWLSGTKVTPNAASLAAALALHLAVAGAVALWPHASPRIEPDAVVSVVFMPSPEPVAAPAPVSEPTPAPAPPTPAPPKPAPTPTPKPMPAPAPKPAPSPEPSPALSKPEAATIDAPAADAAIEAQAADSSPATASPDSTAAPAPLTRSVLSNRTLATPVEAPKPHYPRAARQRGWEGVVVLAVTVGIDGVPASVEVKIGSGIDVLDKAALGAVRHWRFAPATEAGNAVIASLEIPVRFSLGES